MCDYALVFNPTAYLYMILFGFMLFFLCQSCLFMPSFLPSVPGMGQGPPFPSHPVVKPIQPSLSTVSTVNTPIQPVTPNQQPVPPAGQPVPSQPPQPLPQQPQPSGNQTTQPSAAPTMVISVSSSSTSNPLLRVKNTGICKQGNKCIIWETVRISCVAKS